VATLATQSGAEPCRRFHIWTLKPRATLAVNSGVFVIAHGCFSLSLNCRSTGGPFTKTNNGYYSSWLALLAAGSFAYVSAEDVVRASVDGEIARQDRALIVVFFASLVELSVAADVCDMGTCTGNETAGLVLGVASLLMVGTHLALVRNRHAWCQTTGRILAPLAISIWAAAAGVNTSTGGPFTSSCDESVPAANGFFSTWIAFFASLYYAWTQLLVFLPPDTISHSFGGDKCDGIGIAAHDQPYQSLSMVEEE
jgi:hypothetical protein